MTNNPSTYPDSWDDLPGTKTQDPSPEHANAKEQEYYLQDSEDPVKKGEHERKDFSKDPDFGGQTGT
jgi:hypothetical protein